MTAESMPTPAYLTDDEIAAICRPLVQHAARVRFLESLNVPVRRRPDGSPLVKRADWDRQQAQNRRVTTGPNWSKAA